MTDIVEQLRHRAQWDVISFSSFDPAMCSEAADEIERLRVECQKLANLLMSEYTWVHEYKVEEVDMALKPYLGTQYDAPVEPADTAEYPERGCVGTGADRLQS